MFYFYLVSAIKNLIFIIEYFMFAIDYFMLAIKQLICNAFMFLQILTTFGPNIKRHIINLCIK